ncbi:MAG: transketolase [Thermoleophilaceae bacterium]|nr:transketolase [Thermoleophilaceae bacterium]
MTTSTIDARALDELCVNTIRTLSMDAVQKANSGHPGTPMALAPLAYVLYTRVMRHNPASPSWFDRDRFVLSAGHASMLLYSTLYLTGYGLELEDLKSFRQLGSPTAGHPEYGHAHGIETTTGPLGQGISTAVGMALAERMLAARYNRPGHEIVNHHTWVIASDGDLEEGVSSEACSLAGHLGLGRLIVFYDDNHISIEGDTGLAFTEDVAKRFEAYGWHVQNLGEDLALDSLEAAALAAKEVEDRPSLVILRTHIAPGSPNKQDSAKAHGEPLGVEEVRLTKEAYGWPADEPFLVPEEVLYHCRKAIDRGREAEREWRAAVDAYRQAEPEAWAELERIVEGRLPEGWDSGVPRFDPADERVGSTLATRKASHSVIQWAAERVPNLVGGSADLAPSTLTLIEGGGDVEKGSYAGRNLHFGVREHGMGAIVNGLVLHGFRAFGSTFLIFSDYMRAAIRLAALMRIPSIFVFTHDSIGLGEDGPTHQPVEQLAGLRAMPNLYVVRPAGANETALAWQFALRQTNRPTALALTRQGVPVWSPDDVPADAVERGAYVLRDARDGREPDVILIGTGSEVHLCAAAQELLEADGLAVRLVSMPCVDRFHEQDDAYRDSVLPPGVRARVAVEAASPLGWHSLVGDQGAVVGMETFGASGPAAAVLEHFGFTPERVAEEARAVLERVGSASVRG